MSYLEMASAPLPDMQKGIISIWFREVSKQQENPPDAKNWPQGFWTDVTATMTMVPPNAQYSIGYDPAFKNNIFFFNPYGMPIGGQFFGDLFLGPAQVWIPNSPPVPLNTWSTTNAIGGVADTDMSKYGIRTLLTFGDPDIDYNYCSWRSEHPDVLDYVHYIDNVVGGPEYILTDYPPPYLPYYFFLYGGDNGKFKVANYRLNPPQPKFKVPQSFIGIDKDGHLIINLQTNSKATYKGMSFEQSNAKNLWATATYLQILGPPYSYTQVGFPFPDGVWIAISGYWQGYEFEYKDISQDIMGCAPESFAIYAATEFVNFAFGAPEVKDNVWHHLLFSFDISGSVTTDHSTPDTPSVSTSCKAWLAFDDKNITGTALQNRPPSHDGLLLPKLRGTQTTQILDCGPCTTYSRDLIKLGDNDILPRNAWVSGFGGNPKDNLIQNFNYAGIISDANDSANNWGRAYGGKIGDFNWVSFTGAIWPLYGNGVAPGPWQATYNPPRPTTPDPKTFDAPKYSCSGFSIPTNGHPIGIPAGSDLNDYNTGVEVAELQIWADQTLDTSDANNRRLFIDKDGKPVPPKTAAKELGKPHILIHGSSAWKKGRNSGSIAEYAADEVVDGVVIHQKGEKNPDGQFKPVARIEKFKPDPKLGQ